MFCKRSVIFFFSLILIGCRFYPSKGINFSNDINFLNNSCAESLQIDIFSWPKGILSLAHGKALVCLAPTLEKALSPHWRKRFLIITHRAFKQANIFKEIDIRERYLTIFPKEIDFLVLLRGVELMAPTKVAPGHLVLEIEILKLKPREELWLLSGELDLCPQYPRDYVVYLGKSHFPQGDPYALERGIFLLAQKMALLIKQTQFPSYRLELEN